MKRGLVCGALLIGFLLLSAGLFYVLGRSIWEPYYQKYRLLKEPQSSQTIIQKIYLPRSCKEPLPCPQEHLTSLQKLHRHLANAQFVLYPEALTLIGLKYERRLEVWGKLHGKWYHIHNYPFTAFSGRLGPKLEEGDRQIPEGIYRVSFLNPKSKFHLALRLNYPNAFDRKVAKKDGRKGLGGDIMIHGSTRTVGCIPIGDEGIEELYFLVEKVGMAQTKVIIAPLDFRRREVVIKNKKYPWLKGLYAQIKKEMEPFSD